MMSEHPESADRIEQQVSSALADLPLLRAPQGLEAAVLAEIARRAALPWYRRNFGQWPMPARVAFVVTSLALIALTLLAHSVHQFGAVPISWSRQALTGVSALFGLGAVVVRAIPPVWLYGGLGFGAMLYVILFGVGAFAYRTLYLAPLQGR